MIVSQNFSVVRNGVEIGTQHVHLLDPMTAFRLTAIENLKGAEIYLKRFLRHTSLRAVQWANLYQTQITCTTLFNKYSCS